MKKAVFATILVAFFALSFASPPLSSAANRYEEAMKKWSRSEEYRNKLGARLIVRATLYTSEFIENLIEMEAEKNLWTASEVEDYKYNFLKGLKLDDYVAIYLELNELGPTAHMAPFDEMVHLWVGNKKYAPAEYDTRFNFPLQGKRDGMIYFPRYDEKTGDLLFKKDVSLRFVMVGAASPVLDGKEVRLAWDVKAGNLDAPTIVAAADRIEIDRLLRRIEKLASEKSDLETQLDAKNREIDEVNSRIEELQRN